MPIDSPAEGFALYLYDADDYLVMCNQRCRDRGNPSADLLLPGITGTTTPAARRARLQANPEIRQHDGRSTQFSNARARSGGTLVTRAARERGADPPRRRGLPKAAGDDMPPAPHAE